MAALTDSANTRDLLVTSLLRLGTVDVFVTSLVALVIASSMGSASLPAYAGVMIVRAAIALGALVLVSAPIRAWQQRPDPSASALSTIEAAVDRFGPGFARAYVGGWVLSMIVLFGLGRAGSLPTSTFGEVELLTGATITLALAAGLPALLIPLFDELLAGLRRQLAKLRIEQGLPAASRSASIGQQLARFMLGLLIALLVGGNGTSMHERGLRVRAETMGTQRERVARLAEQLRAQTVEGDVQLESGVELIAFDELPTALLPSEPLALGELTSVYDFESEQALAAAPIDAQRWLLARGHAELHTMWLLLMQLVIMAGALVVVAFAGSAFRRTIVEPLTRLDDATRRLAEHGQLTSIERIVPTRNDELGSLIGSFNRMLDVFEHLTQAAASVAKGDLRVDIKGSGELPDALRGMLARLNEVVEQIRSTSLELASAATEIHAITREQEAAAEQQSQRVLDVSDTVATLAQSAEDISSNANDVLANAEQVLHTTDLMIARIDKLNAQAGSVRELLELIREVADRSDLLALNGSLEATRAGEAGRGFALVASEMRRLAERVTGTIGDVRDRLAEIEAAGTSTVQATGDSRRLASETAAAARTISTVTSRQSAETDQVSIKVFEVAEVMIATVEATRQTLSAVEGLRLQAIELERLTGQFQLREERSGRAGSQVGRK